MRVFVECRHCGARIYLDEVYDSPNDYPDQIRLSCEECGRDAFYRREELRAEEGTNATAAGALLGGLAGSVGGPVGVAIGAGVGGVLGQNQDQQEKERVREFNDRYYHQNH